MLNPKLAMAARMTEANAINRGVGAARLAGIGALGLGGLAVAANMFGNDQQAQSPQQSMTVIAQPPASASQAVPVQTVPMLNEEQISKAQRRAQEQAALNAYYAQSLGQYPGGQE